MATSTVITRRLRSLAALIVISFLVACSAGLPTGVACTDELRILLNPRDTTVRVGATYEARVELSTCGGRKRLFDSFTWTVVDSAVAHVDRYTGRVTALSIGVTQIYVEGARYGRLGVGRIAVQAAAP